MASCVVLLAFFGKTDIVRVFFTLLISDLFIWNFASSIIDFYKDREPKSRLKRLFKKYINFKFDRSLVFLPILIVVPLSLILWWYFQPSRSGVNLLYAAFSILLAPFLEEYLFRQLFFDDLLLKRIGGSFHLSNSGINIWVARFWSFVALIFQSVIFVYAHEDTAPGFSFWSRFAMGLVCGILYLKYKRNLLPGISAHATSNLLLFIASLN